MDPRSFPASQKLKDTCEMCSVAKIKCSKEKPICSRCKKSGYSCFYSPARRVGRPHPHGQNSSRTKSNRAQDVVRKPTISHFRDGSVESNFNSSSNGGRASGQNDCTRGKTPRVQGQDIRTNTGPVMQLQGSQQMSQFTSFQSFPAEEIHQISFDNSSNFEGTMIALEEEGLCCQASSSAKNVFHDTVALDHRCTSITQNDKRTNSQAPNRGCKQSPYFRRRDVTNRHINFVHDPPFNLESLDDPMEGTHWQSTLGDECSTLNRRLSSQQAIIDSTAKSSLRTLEADDYTSSTPEYDCTTIAMNLLHQLNQTCLKQEQPNTPSNSEFPTLEHLIDTVSIAVKRLSTILSCHCSQKTDVALLAAGVCVAILDTYGAVFRNSKINCSSSAIWVDNITRGSEAMGREEQMTTVRVLGELPRVANLVTQFSKQYVSQPGEDGSREFLSALIAELKFKLKSMSNEVSNWLAQV